MLWDNTDAHTYIILMCALCFQRLRAVFQWRSITSNRTNVHTYIDISGWQNVHRTSHPTPKIDNLSEDITCIISKDRDPHDSRSHVDRDGAR